MSPELSHLFQFHSPSFKRLHIELCAPLGDDDVDKLVQATVEVLAERPQVREVLIDVRKLVDCVTSVQTGFGSLQKLLGRRGMRTAWLSNSGRMHGLSRFVVTRVADPNAATCITMGEVEAWFADTRGRFEVLKANAGRKP